jgi:hypothetical protein
MNGSAPESRHAITVTDLDQMQVHLSDTDHNALWWVALTQQVDAFDDHLARHRADVEGPGGLHSQVLADAPRMAPEVARLEIEHDRLGDLIRQIRIRVGELAGDPASTDEAIALVSDLVQRLRRHDEAAASLLHEAYRVDIGGE